MTKRAEWVALPLKWLRTVSFESLSASDLRLLLLLWGFAPGGKVPRIGKRAQIELGIAHRPKRLAEMLIKLRNIGFLEDESATHYKLKDWDRYVGRYRQSAHKPAPKLARKKQTNQTKTPTSGESSRARAPLPLREGDKRGEKGGPLETAPFTPSNYPKRVLDLINEHGKKQQ